MTTDVARLEQSVLTTFDRLMADWSSPILQLCTPTVDQAASIWAGELDGGGAFTAQSGPAAPTATDVKGFRSASSPAVYERLVKITFRQERDVPDLADKIARILMQKATNAWAADFWTLLGAGRTTAHPENGVASSPYAANGGGTVYFVDNFDMTFINGGTATQTNDHSLALSAANVDTLLAKRAAYKDRDGVAYLRETKPLLVYGPSDLTTGRNVRDINVPTYDGTGLRSAVANDIGGFIRAPTGFASGAWALVYIDEYVDPSGRQGRQCPVRLHVRQWPTIRIREATDANALNVIGEMEYDAFYAPFEGDLLYSKP